MKYAHYYTGPLDEKLVHKASAYFTRLIDASKDSAYLAPERFLALPYDMKHLEYVKKALAPFVSGKLKYVFVAGIVQHFLHADCRTGTKWQTQCHRI